MKIRGFALAIAVACAAVCTPALGQDQTPTITYDDADKAMNGAIAEARSYLPQFFAIFDKAGPAQQQGLFSLKVQFPKTDGQPGHEHIWVGDIERKGADFSATLANRPDHLKGLKQGSPVSFTESQISDWHVATQEGLYGAFTLRVMLKDLSPELAAEQQKMLAPTTVPQSWRK